MTRAILVRIYRSDWSAQLAVAVAVIALTVYLQIRLGAYRSELDGDESSHYVSGLVVHDYLAAGLLESPLAFLRRFHSSYPLVGIGRWGPLYYGVEALWMMLFGWGRIAMIALSATMTAAVALAIYGTASRPFGHVLSAFAALAFVASPIVQTGSDSLMLDVPIALLCWFAMLAYRHYLETRRTRFCLTFALLAAAGMLIKGNTTATVLLGLCALPWILDVPAKPKLGLIEAARAIRSHLIAANPSVLIATDGAEEGAAVAELALDDSGRPSLYAIRGSRLLGGGGYNTEPVITFRASTTQVT
jgi:hypothetical protein